MNHTKPRSLLSFRATPFCVLAMCAQILSGTVVGQEPKRDQGDDHSKVEIQWFDRDIRPLVEKYCIRCHNADKMKSGIRLDRLSIESGDEHLFLFEDMFEQLTDLAMPPDGEPQPTAEQRKRLVDWIGKTIAAARSRGVQKNGSARRLTVSQYRNSLRDLLGIEADLTDVLPPDGISKDGFANNGQTMVLSPLQVESYFEIAEKALAMCIVDSAATPVVQSFQLEFGESINPMPISDKLILGANSHLLNTKDFLITELSPVKDFRYEPFTMRTKYEFIEGYAGNATVRGWKKFDTIYHSVFACMRGTAGYPKGRPYDVTDKGLLLRPAIPSSEIFGTSSTYGPRANFKISLRELPDQGSFRVTVKAARYDDALLLDRGAETRTAAESITISSSDLKSASSSEIVITHDGVFQLDVFCETAGKQQPFSIKLGERTFSGTLAKVSGARPKTKSQNEGSTLAGQAFMLVRLPAGPLEVKPIVGDGTRPYHIVFSRIEQDDLKSREFVKFEKRTPWVGVHLGLRRDCGSTLARVGNAREVLSTELTEFVFEGAISDFPSPDVEKNNVNYLAGVREIGIRNEYTDGRDLPRLIIRSVTFEGPFYEQWPPAAHRNIFIDSVNRDKPKEYARELIEAFATRAFRRPVTPAEASSLVAVWEASFGEHGEFQESIKDAFLVVLTSPQFLFLIENSASPDAEELSSFEVASKLSYFLWNSAPDEQLVDRARRGDLIGSLDEEIDRMIDDAKFSQFIDEFVPQWLSLDKFDVVEVDQKMFPKLTRDMKAHLRSEPIRFFRYLIENDLSLQKLILSDFIMANDAVADYYGLADRTESGLQFGPVRHESDRLGGLLVQASIMAGLSDGRESNPVKRGAWLARKIISEPPDDPPPNVPDLEDDDTERSLRERLERHRNQPGCVKCHKGIDPWGLPFESLNAGGTWKREPAATHTTLPDGTEIENLNGLKSYLAHERFDKVVFSFLKHLATYALGRSLTYKELAFLKQESVRLQGGNCRMRDLFKLVVKSDLFLTK